MIARIINLPDSHSFVLLGPRQTGKSTLLNDFLKNKRSFTVNLLHSNELFRYIKAPSAFRKEASYAIKNENAEVVFVDEIQKIPELLDEIQALISDFPMVQFIVSGSSARKLKRGAANLLAGRLRERFLFPFVHTELGKNFTIEDVLCFGSLPPTYQLSSYEKKDFLLSYVNMYLKEEIQAEGIVRNLGGFSRFLEVAAAQNAEMVNFSSIARDCQLPSRTVQSYYEILEDTLIGIRINGWRKSIRKRMLTHPKYYFFDVGVSNALCRRLDPVTDPALKGKLFEQWIIIETYRYVSYYFPDIRLHYWHTSGGAEVDLLFEKAGEIICACEFKISKSISTTHLRGLLSFAEEFINVPRYLVCFCEKPFEEKGIKVLPWENYLNLISTTKLF